MKITKTVEVDPADMTTAQLKLLTKAQLINVVKVLQNELYHAHDHIR